MRQNPHEGVVDRSGTGSGSSTSEIKQEHDAVSCTLATAQVNVWHVSYHVVRQPIYPNITASNKEQVADTALCVCARVSA